MLTIYFSPRNKTVFFTSTKTFAYNNQNVLQQNTFCCFNQFLFLGVKITMNWRILLDFSTQTTTDIIQMPHWLFHIGICLIIYARCMICLSYSFYQGENLMNILDPFLLPLLSTGCISAYNSQREVRLTSLIIQSFFSKYKC